MLQVSSKCRGPHFTLIDAVFGATLSFDFIIAMDESNVENIEKLRPQTNTRARVLKMRDFDELDKGGNVPDPYFGGLQGFENVYEILLNCNTRFIDYLEKTT